MEKIKNLCPLNMAFFFLFIFMNLPIQAFAEDTNPQFNVPDGIQLKLTKDFYDSLLDKNKRGGTLYSNDPSMEYLKEIAISARFMVETNFQIMEQNERIIKLLQSLLKE